MRRLVVVSVFLLCAAFAAATHAAVPANDEAMLRRLSAEWMQALERKDLPALEATLAPNYRLRFPGDTPAQATYRALWLKNAIEMDWTRFKYENVEVRVHGDLAIVSSHLRFHVSPFPFELDSGVVDVWERRNGRWQVVERMLGESATQARIGFWSGALMAAAVCGAWALLARWRRRRRGAGA
jgi:ketosteroid isomerase-like protein